MIEKRFSSINIANKEKTKVSRERDWRLPAKPGRARRSEQELGDLSDP